MKKILIKIIKRKDAEAVVNAKTRSALRAKQSAPDSEEKIERRSRREMVATITNRVSENRKNNLIEELSAIRKFYGSEPLLSEI